VKISDYSVQRYLSLRVVHNCGHCLLVPQLAPETC
jgi:hypothetical protein